MSLLNSVRPGDRVTIVDRFGKRRTGKAVMKGTYGWVLNMGGAHGTPGIADDDNVVDVRSSTGKAKHTGSNPGKGFDGLYTADQVKRMLPDWNAAKEGLPAKGKKLVIALPPPAILNLIEVTKTDMNATYGGKLYRVTMTRGSSNPPGFVIIQGTRRIRFATLDAARKAANEYQRRTGKFVNISREDKKSNPPGGSNPRRRGKNPSIPVGSFMGHAIFFLHISYNCPSLKLYGYSTERAIKNAIKRKLKTKSNPRRAYKRRAKNPRGKRGGFKRLVAKLKRRGARTPKALAAWIERKKYGKVKFAKMSRAGRKRARR